MVLVGEVLIVGEVVGEFVGEVVGAVYWLGQCWLGIKYIVSGGKFWKGGRGGSEGRNL